MLYFDLGFCLEMRGGLKTGHKEHKGIELTDAATRQQLPGLYGYRT